MRPGRSCLRGIRLRLLGLALGLLVLVPSAAGAPVVSVKARTDIKLLPILHGDDGVVVRGDLLDQVTQRPIPFQNLLVTMNQRRKRVRTDESGRFEARFRFEEDRYDIAVSFADSDQYAGSSATLSGVDIEKQTVVLTIRVDDPELTGDTLEVTVEAKTEDGVGAALSVDLYAGRSGEELEYITKLSTDMRGIGTYSLERAALGGLGRKRFEVKFLGNRSYNPTEAQTEVVLSTATRTTLIAASLRIAYEADLDANGVVSDENGVGVAGETVSLRLGGRRLASALTDEQGRFSFEVPGSDLGAGSFGIQATFDPLKPWYIKSRSPVLQVTVADPQPVPVRHTLAAFGATAMAMLAFLGLRTRPWRGWLERLRRLRERREAPPEEEDEAPAAPEGGMHTANPGLMSSLRRPHLYSFNGTVRDAVTERRVEGAVVQIAHPDRHQQRQECDRRGRFEFDDLVAGLWQAEVRMSGYVTEAFTLTVPHRGEFAGVRIDLVAVRERIFAMYREVAEPLLPDRSKWGIWTPRQIFRHVRKQDPAPALSDLTGFVEETYFSQRIPQESVLGEAGERIERVRSEQAALVAAKRDAPKASG